MLTINELTDDKLREELNHRGFNIGPITHSTRKVYERKLAKIFDHEGIEYINNDIRNESTLNGSHQNPLSDSLLFTETVKENGTHQHVSPSIHPQSPMDEDPNNDDEYDGSEESRVLSPDEWALQFSRISKSAENSYLKGNGHSKEHNSVIGVKKASPNKTFLFTFFLFLMVVTGFFANQYGYIDFNYEWLQSKLSKLTDFYNHWTKKLINSTNGKTEV